MLDVRLKMIEEKLYEEITKTLEECDVPLMFACSILKNIEGKLQDRTIAELAFRLLKQESEQINNNKDNQNQEENND